MIPWERDIYVTFLNDYVEEENRKIEEQRRNR